MLEGTSATGAFGGLQSLTAGQSTSLGQDQFLKLLVAQLRYQSPLNPLQPHEFAAQLASFSSVEQLNQVNESLAQQARSLDLAALLTKVNFGASLVGRRVIALGNQVAIPPQGGGEIDVKIGGSGEATLRLYDDSGRLVATRELGSVVSGRQRLALPDDLPEGVYTYELEVTGADGSEVSVTSYVSGVVDGVRFDETQIILQVGDLTVPVDSVIEILAASSASSESGTEGGDESGEGTGDGDASGEGNDARVDAPGGKNPPAVELPGLPGRGLASSSAPW